MSFSPGQVTLFTAQLAKEEIRLKATIIPIFKMKN
jgi:hypothetical protein